MAGNKGKWRSGRT